MLNIHNEQIIQMELENELHPFNPNIAIGPNANVMSHMIQIGAHKL